MILSNLQFNSQHSRGEELKKQLKYDMSDQIRWNAAIVFLNTAQ